MDKIKEPEPFGSGCVVAHILGLKYIPCAIHHFTIGGKHGQKRRGHDYTIGLNDWSHQGYTVMGWSKDECLERLGPSYADDPGAFRDMFGSDDELLKIQNDLIGYPTNGVEISG